MAERRGAERVFVGGELDDRGRVEAELARHVIDRLARLVGHEVEQLAVGNVLNRNHSLVWSRVRQMSSGDGAGAASCG
jgi:hypothetical protein